MTTARSNDLPTLLDLTKSMAPDGTALDVVDALSRNNPFLENLVFKQGNTPTGHIFGALNGLPPIAWRRFNEGVPAGKSKKDQITESCGMLTGISKVDSALADLNGDAATFRAGEDKAFISAFKNELETGFFYHSTKTAPEKFMGLSPRLDALSGIPYSSQVINATAGGAASGNDSTSVWAMVSSPETVFGITPKNLPGGLKMKDLGERLVKDDNNNEFVALVSTWDWRVGLCVQDARYVVRLANIDTSGIVKAKTAMLSIEKDIERGTWVLMFMGIPIYMTDAILNTETPLA